MKTHLDPKRKRHGPAAMLTAILIALMLAPASGQVPEFGPLQEDYFEIGLEPHYPEELAIMFPALADIDNDGDLDVFYLGSDNDNLPRSQMYRNDGGDVFTEVFPAITGLSYACCDFADIDNDGYVGISDLAKLGTFWLSQKPTYEIDQYDPINPSTE